MHTEMIKIIQYSLKYDRGTIILYQLNPPVWHPRICKYHCWGIYFLFPWNIFSYFYLVLYFKKRLMKWGFYQTFKKSYCRVIHYSVYCSILLLVILFSLFLHLSLHLAFSEITVTRGQCALYPFFPFTVSNVLYPPPLATQNRKKGESKWSGF